jgi:hypothetical protein
MNADARDELERLREQLRQALHTVRLAPGSEAATIRAAHRRRWLRRGLVGAGVAALVGGGVTAIAGRDSSEPGGLATRADGPSAAEMAAEVGRDVAPAPPTTAVAMVAIDEAATTQSTAGTAVDYPPAVAVDPLLAWSEVSPRPGPEPPEAWAGRVPGVVIGTGAAGWDAYYTADGVAFEPLGVTPPSGALIAPVADGDAIYSVGVDVGPAASPLVLDVSTDRGATWSSARLPVDTAIPFESEHVTISLGTELAMTDAGPVVLATERVDFDPSGFPELAGSGATGIDHDGVILFDDCGMSPPDEPTASPAPCEPRRFTWADLGLTDAEAAALTRGARTRAFRLAGGVVDELTAPPDTATMGVAHPGLFWRSRLGPDGQSFDDPISWRLTAAGEWQEVDVAPDLAPFGAVPYTVGEATLVLGANGESTMPVFGVSTGSGWAYATTDGLFGEHAVPFVSSSTATGDVLVAAVSVRTDLIAAEGGVEAESAGVVVRREGEVEDWLVLTADDRAPIAGATIDWDRPEGGFVVRDETGAVLAEFDAAAIDALLDPASPPSWSIVTTADGRNVAVESVAELLGVVDEITDVRVNAAGDKVIATVSLTTGETPRILLGAPPG